MNLEKVTAKLEIFGKND